MKSALQHPFHPRIDPRPVMEKALDKAIEISAGTKCYSITDGRLVHEQQHRYRYTFVLESPWDLADGTAFQLKSSDFDHLPIELSNTKGEVITITTTQRLPEHTLTAAHLIIERAYLLRKMKEALTRVSTPADLGLKLFGYLNCPDETAASSLVDLISDVFVPDDAQRLAIQRALASDVQMILGPGGTGKTDVLAAIAMQHVLLYKHRVLICSHTNIAIDNAVIRLATFFRKHGQDDFLDEQNLIRYGRPHLSLLETDDYCHVTMSLIVNDAIEQQHEEIACLKDRHTALLQQITMAEEELPGQIRAWEQRQEALSLQRVQVTTDLDTLEEEEQRRLTPILEQLTAQLTCDSQAEQTMERAQRGQLTDEALLSPLQQEYTRQWQFYQEEQKKLQRLRVYGSVSRFFVQIMTGEWEKTLDARVNDCVVSLEALHEQMSTILERLAATKQTYLQAEQLRERLKPSIASLTRKRHRRPASSATSVLDAQESSVHTRTGDA